MQRIHHHYDVIRHSLSAKRADNTDILIATRMLLTTKRMGMRIRSHSKPPYITEITQITGNVYNRSIKQLLHVVTGSMEFCTLEGWNGTRGEAEGAISPTRVYKTHGPQSQRATIVLLYLRIIIIPLLEVSSVVIFKHYYDELFIV